MSASMHHHTCHTLGLCLGRQPPCERTCEQAQEQDDEPLLHAEDCAPACLKALAMGALCAMLLVGSCLLGLRWLWSNWP